jgi:hypothetical protein
MPRFGGHASAYEYRRGCRKKACHDQVRSNKLKRVKPGYLGGVDPSRRIRTVVGTGALTVTPVKPLFHYGWAP